MIVGEVSGEISAEASSESPGGLRFAGAPTMASPLAVPPGRPAPDVVTADIVLTTYGLLHRDAPQLAGVPWGAVILDEAQNVKNAHTRQSRAARALGARAPIRLALTGTPVENRLSELWSILDFLNPGYLGSQRRFQERLARPIERDGDGDAARRLQELVRPFILRRLKTDPDVAPDLPAKIERVSFCPLTPEQAALYEAAVRSGLDGLERIESGRGVSGRGVSGRSGRAPGRDPLTLAAADAPGDGARGQRGGGPSGASMRRRGAILALITALKQICNHPAQYLKDGGPLPGRSGKLERLEELLEEIVAAGDRALIFTQFTGLADLLRPYLESRFGVETLYLHGGVPLAGRKLLTERFQASRGPMLFLISSRAGGTGITLTNAAHVIHYDRLWNPAVEDQATDRAHRIGQRRTVQVHKLVCPGTLEERIDALIASKKALAERVVGQGEAWLTELSGESLRDLVGLRLDAPSGASSR